VACFAYRHEAQNFEKALKERLAKFGLEVAADKTKTLRFGFNGGPQNGRFDFFGFEFYWEPDRQCQTEGQAAHGHQEIEGRDTTDD
jgi:hypothetical protein